MLSLCPLAYIDPMSGAIILQVIVAGVIGCGAFFRRSIMATIRKLFRRGDAPTQPVEDEPVKEGPDAT